MQAVLCVNYLGDKCLSHAKLMSTALTQLLIFRFSYLLTNKGTAQHIDNPNYPLQTITIFIYLFLSITLMFQDQLKY